MPPSEPQRFSTSFDKASIAITAVSCAVLAGVIAFTRNPIAIGVALFVVAVSYALSPKEYLVSDRSIIVRRLIGDVRIPLDAVREIRPATSDDLSGAIRLWANGGLFGFYGLFHSPKLGRSWWYLRRRRNLVVVRTERKTALFSPDDPNAFLMAIQAAAGHSSQPLP